MLYSIMYCTGGDFVEICFICSGEHIGQKGLCFCQSLYKGSVIRNDRKSLYFWGSENGKIGHKFMSGSTNFEMQKSDFFLLGLISSIKKVYYIEYEVIKMNQQATPLNWRK